VLRAGHWPGILSASGCASPGRGAMGHSQTHQAAQSMATKFDRSSTARLRPAASQSFVGHASIAIAYSRQCRWASAGTQLVHTAPAGSWSPSIRRQTAGSEMAAATTPTPEVKTSVWRSSHPDCHEFNVHGRAQPHQPTCAMLAISIQRVRLHQTALECSTGRLLTGEILGYTVL